MKKFIPLLLIVVIVVFAACEPPNAVTRISAQEAYVMMGGLDSFVLLDVRTYGEFRQRRIAGAILIPYDNINELALTKITDKNIVILVYCQAGRRSAIASNALASLGYTRIYDFGGINSWLFSTVSG